MIARIEVGSNNLYATSVNPSDDRLCLYLAGGQFLSQLLPLLTGRCEVTCLEPVHVVHALLVRLLGVSAVISCWDSFFGPSAANSSFYGSQFRGPQIEKRDLTLSPYFWLISGVRERAQATTKLWWHSTSTSYLQPSLVLILMGLGSGRAEICHWFSWHFVLFSRDCQNGA